MQLTSERSTTLPDERTLGLSPHGLSRVTSPLLLLGIVALSATLRMLLWTCFQGQPLHIWDERDYNLLARNLIVHHEFSFEPGSPAALRPPLYPMFLAGIYVIVGESPQAVRLVQTLLALAMALILFCLGTELHSRKAGLVTAALWLFYPSWLIQPNFLLTETLFTCLLVSSCYTVVLFYRRDRLGYLALSGLLLGLAALTRSVVWLSPPLLALFIAITCQGTWQRRLIAAIVLVSAFAGTIAPWSIRNSRLFGTFVAVDVMGGRNLMMGNYEHTPLYRSWDTISINDERAWYRILREKHSAGELRTQAHVDKLAMREALSFMAANPGRTIQRTIVKFFDFWGLERELVAGASRGYWGELPAALILTIGLVIMSAYAGLLFAGIFGVVVCRLPDWRLHLLLACTILYICGIHSLAFGHSRYHLPVMPLVFVFSSLAIIRRREIWQQRYSWPFYSAIATCLVFLLGWGWNFVAGDGARLLSLVNMV